MAKVAATSHRAAIDLIGEIDIVVVNQGGDVLLMEVKSGNVDFTAEGIFKSYTGKVKNVTAQIGLQYGALRTRLEDAALHVRLHHLLVLPDLKVQTCLLYTSDAADE